MDRHYSDLSYIIGNKSIEKGKGLPMARSKSGPQGQQRQRELTVPVGLSVEVGLNRPWQALHS